MQPSELISRRKSLGLTQAELAQKLDITVTTVARWEQGKAKIPGMLRLLLQYLQDDMEEMTDEEREQRNLAAWQRTQEAIEKEAQTPSPERDRAERWFGKY